MFTSPTAWNQLYGPPHAPALTPEAAARRHSHVFTAATTAAGAAPAPPYTLSDDRVGVPLSGYAHHKAVPPPAHALFAPLTTSSSVPSPSHYTVASQPVRCFPLPPTPAAAPSSHELHLHTSAYRGDSGGWSHADNALPKENHYEPMRPPRATAQSWHSTCGPHQSLQSPLRVSGTMDPGADGGLFGAGAAAVPYAMHTAYSAKMAAGAEEEACENDSTSQYHPGVPGARRHLHRSPPRMHGNLVSSYRGAPPWPAIQLTSPVECEEASKVTAVVTQDTSWLQHATLGSREGCREPAVGVKLAAHTPHDVAGGYTDGQLLAPPPPHPLPPRHEYFDQEQQQPQAHAYSSISDGARHLNSARHRSAASAAALFFHSPSVTDGLASSPGAGSSAAFRHRGRAAVATSAVSSTATGTPTLLATAASAAAAQAEPCCVAALIFNNAKEVGVALCELPSLTVSLCQYGDTATFFKTTSLLHTRNPVEVLVPSTAVDSELVQTVLRHHGAHMTFTSVQRCFYNAEEGVQRLSQLKSSAEASLCIEDTDRYLCVAAANAVVLYMEHVNDMHLLPGSVRVRAEALEHYMEVSRTTARALQLIPDITCIPATAAAAPMGLMGNTANGSETTDGSQRGRTQRYGAMLAPVFLSRDLVEPPLLQTVALVDAIPRACTVMGQRYLRRTLLQPLRDRVAVQGRHDAVEWLLCDPRRLHVLRTLLRHTAALDLERLTATLTHQPRRERSSAQQQSYLESLQLLWSALPHLEQLHAQLKAYLGPLPRGQASVYSEGVSPATLSPLPDGGPEAPALPNDLCSTAAHPSVLHSIATALGACRFPELETLMGTYLERSVLPSVVGYYAKSTAHYGTLHDVDSGSTHIPSSVSVVTQQQQQHSQRRRRRLRSDDGAEPDSSRHAQQPSQRVTTALLRLLRMCFLVQAPRSGELDALRTRLSLRISNITSYAAELRATYGIFSLRLEPDPVKLYCLSYAVAEEAKAKAGPFTWRYAGGSHFALYLSALREQQLQRQQEQPQSQGRIRRSSRFHLPTSAGDALCTASSSSSMELSRHTDDVECAGFDSSAIDPFSPFTSGTDHTASRQLRRRRVRCSTEDLDYRCARAQECVAAILQLQLHSVQPLVRAIQHEFLGSLQATVESVALLDTLLCFALYSLTHQCTRPVLVELRTGSTTAPRMRTLTAEPTEDVGEAVASSVRKATAREGSAGASWDSADEYIKATRAPAVVGDQGSETAVSAGASETSSDATTPSRTPSLPTLTAPATAAVATTEAETHHASGVRLCLENARHPSATQRQPPSRAVARAGMSARFTGAEVAGMVAPASGGLTMSWGSDGGDVCIVTGPNACGKTTLLRILGQYFTLAQAGCFVPAQHAQLFLADRLLAHMLCDELPSITHSSFRPELMELGELTHAATAESVALIDELGRNTTTAQGFSLAWATALLLSDRCVHSVLTTHYAGLPRLARLRPRRIVAFHFRVTFQQLAAVGRGRDGATDSSLREPARTRITIARFGHTLFPGPCRQRWYGLALAERLHFFEPVLDIARRTRSCRSPAGVRTEADTM
ncbi:mis-match repair protein, putative [Leishmania tarentolae]|uniref:Mis-match repair protein, putative n=1 Tax=Leishmania tarentolae TaxID=5689 RepID=A0A640KGA7_LEITA|nr:mis-match repair protein, putative [Leishmania tarentolae]